MCTRALLQPQGEVTTGADRPTAKFDRTGPRQASDFNLGIGLADSVKRDLMTRKERLRIAEEGS